MMQAALPYDARYRTLVPGADSGAVSIPQVTATNFVNYDINFTDLSAASVSHLPELISTVEGGAITYLWGDATLYGIPFVHLFDAAILGVVPAKGPNYSGSGSTCTYTCGLFWGDSWPFGTQFVAPQIAAGTVTTGPGRNIGSSGEAFIIPTSFVLSAGPSSYGNVHPCVDTGEGRRAVWIDASASDPAVVTFTMMTDVNTSTASGALFAYATRETTGVEVGSEAPVVFPSFTAVSTNAVTTSSGNIEASGYYSFKWAGTLNPNVPTNSCGFSSVAISIVTRTSLVSRHIINPWPVVDSVPTMELVQVNGASLLLHNTQARIGQGGMVYATSLFGNQSWPAFVSNTSLITSCNRMDHYQGGLDKGIYGFIKPCHRPPLRSFVDVDSEGIPLLHSYVQDPGASTTTRSLGGNVYYVTPPGGDTSSYPVTATLTFTVTYQFTTVSQMWNLSLPPTCVSLLEDALAALGQMSPFTENPIHVAAILAAIRALAGFAVMAYSVGSGIYTAVKELRSDATSRYRTGAQSWGPAAGWGD
jgi:hypothetical protein